MYTERNYDFSNLFHSTLYNLQKIPTTIPATCRKAGVAIIKYVLCPILKYTVGLVRLISQKIWDGTNVRDSDVVLVLYAKHDWNGASFIPHPLAQLKIHSHKKIEVIYKEVSSIADIHDTVKKIKDQNNRIRNLWINAHGNSDVIVLDDTNFLHNGTVNELRPALDSLEKGASIILQCCKTGYIDSDSFTNIAQSIATTAPHTKVFAPLHSIAAINCDAYWEGDSLRAKFAIPQKSVKNGILGKIMNIAYFAGFYLSMGTLYQQSDTGVFKHFDMSQFEPSSP